MRSGWNGSSASIFSPVPISMIGLPVTARIDSAAPPRASPSTRVSTMPVTPARSSKALATLTASWPVIASATSRVSVRLRRLAHRGHLEHQLFVDVEPAGGIEDARRRSLRAAPVSSARRVIATGRSPATIGRRRDADLRAERGQLLLRRRPLHVERGHQHLLALARLEAQRDLGGGRGLARALQADQHDRRPAASR